MFWIIVLAVGVALTFTTLGAYSVWFKILVAGLKLALLVLSVLTLAFIWKRVFRGPSPVPKGSS